MFVKVLSESDYKILLDAGCKHISKTLISDGSGKVDVLFTVFVPKECMEEFNKLEVNVIRSNTLTF